MEAAVQLVQFHQLVLTAPKMETKQALTAGALFALIVNHLQHVQTDLKTVKKPE